LSLVLLASSASAQSISLNLTNRTGTTITAMKAAEKTAPDVVLPFSFPNQLTEAETDKASITLPEGVCLVDITYSLATGRKVVEENVDLCNIDGVIVE
jgi:hypothetical protein